MKIKLLSLELEMMELVDGRIYRVKNFAKHQNIKVKEQTNSKESVIAAPKNTEEGVQEIVTSENYINEDEKMDNENKKFENKVDKEKTEYTIKNYDERKESIHREINEEKYKYNF